MGVPTIEATKAVASVKKLTSRSEHHHKHFLESGILPLSPKVKAKKVCNLVPSFKFDLKLQTITHFMIFEAIFSIPFCYHK